MGAGVRSTLPAAPHARVLAPRRPRAHWLVEHGYSINSSARRSSECGIGRPIALAVFTFMINSNRLSLVTSCSCIYCRPHPEWGVWGIMQDPRLVCQPGEHQPQTPQRARLASCSDGGSGRRERNSTRPLLGSLTSSASGGARAARSAVSCDGKVCRLRSGERTRRKPRRRGGRRRRRSDLAV